MPHNATAQERALEAVIAPPLMPPVPLREIWDPETCPANLLPWLAFAFSVGEWNPYWPEAAKREVIRQSFQVHRRKGTVGAVRRALEAVFDNAQLQEWFETGGAGRHLMPLWVLRNLPFLLLLGALAGSVWWITDLVRDRQQLRSDLVAVQEDLRGARAELQRAAETAQIHRAHLGRAANEARHWAALSNELELMGGRNAPLSALLGVTAARLYGARQ